MTTYDTNRLFSSYNCNKKQLEDMAYVRMKCEEAANTISQVVICAQDCDRAIAKIQEAMMIANAGIAAEHQE